MSNERVGVEKKRGKNRGELRALLRKKGLLVHFIGVCGVSMYSLAVFSAERGYKVSGSDAVMSERIKKLSDRGILAYAGHSKEVAGRAELVVYSHAVSSADPEREEAERLKIPCLSRAEFMGEIMLEYKRRIGVCGTHGKSTAVAMLSEIFEQAGRRPSVLSGAELRGGEPYLSGERQVLIYEACEYRDSFLSFYPTVALGLNLEYDHPDYFRDIEQLLGSFTRALGRASDFAAINLDDENLKKIYPLIKERRRVVTFGQGQGCDYRYFISSFLPSGYAFKLICSNGDCFDFEIGLSGTHFVTDAVGAIAVALECAIPYPEIYQAIKEYRGIRGRMERIGKIGGCSVYYDYAHHPTEIRAGINSLRQGGSEPITVVFKPHTYSRTLALWDDFCSALSLADRVVITDIYPAREEPIEGVSAQYLAESIKNAVYSPDSMVNHFLDTAGGGVIVLMGAGDFGEIRKNLLG